jgi:hypothetical protein
MSGVNTLQVVHRIVDGDGRVISFGPDLDDPCLWELAADGVALVLDSDEATDLANSILELVKT